ncbi:MAG: ParB N-terminal domain-containing protein [Phycisphaerales bacterium]|nr:ParB N-terminal domain-containing protein [Phycisphaerales bacterium]
MNLMELPMAHLHAHPRNSNRMAPELLDKLKLHLQRSDRYPPIIVRPYPQANLANGETAQGHYQLLDGHHRVRALRELGRTTARCVVWEVDDAQALELLATLNRLQGKDDPRARAALVDDWQQRCGWIYKPCHSACPRMPRRWKD